VAGAAIAIAAGTGGKGDGGGTTAERATTAARSQAKPKPKTQASQPQTTTQAPAQTTQPAAPAAQAQSDDPVALNDQGFALIGQGKATDAVAPLQRSVEAFRAQRRKGDIGYAYALYNLGNALRLSGRPAEAIPYLEERLQISSYKRGIVKKELKTAREQAG
jgi:serine/threonine-protein kinase